MCGRFVSATDPDGLLRFFTIDERQDDDLPANYNVAPTDLAPAVAQHDDRRYLVTLRWGLVPRWAKDRSGAARMINARTETVATKPAFRDSLRRRRCLVPADGFYEWRTTGEGHKVPHFIHPPAGLLAFAGLWDSWRDPSVPDAPPLRTFTILTTAAHGAVTQLHDRMPVALPADAWSAWLDPQTGAAEIDGLLRLPPPELQFHAVSARANSVRNNDPTLIAALPEGPQAAGTLPL